MNIGLESKNGQEVTNIERVKLSLVKIDLFKRKQLQLDIEGEKILKLLSKAWGCSQSDVINRLLFETAKKYGDIIKANDE